jgi:hypothetical protein
MQAGSLRSMRRITCLIDNTCAVVLYIHTVMRKIRFALALFFLIFALVDLSMAAGCCMQGCDDDDSDSACFCCCRHVIVVNPAVVDSGTLQLSVPRTPLLFNHRSKVEAIYHPPRIG